VILIKYDFVSIELKIVWRFCMFDVFFV